MRVLQRGVSRLKCCGQLCLAAQLRRLVGSKQKLGKSDENKKIGPISRRELSRLWHYAKPESQWLAAGSGCMAIGTGVTMLMPAAFGRIIDIATVLCLLCIVSLVKEIPVGLTCLLIGCSQWHVTGSVVDGIGHCIYHWRSGQCRPYLLLFPHISLRHQTHPTRSLCKH